MASIRSDPQPSILLLPGDYSPHSAHDHVVLGSASAPLSVEAAAALQALLTSHHPPTHPAPNSFHLLLAATAALLHRLAPGLSAFSIPVFPPPSPASPASSTPPRPAPLLLRLHFDGQPQTFSDLLIFILNALRSPPPLPFSPSPLPARVRFIHAAHPPDHPLLLHAPDLSFVFDPPPPNHPPVLSVLYNSLLFSPARIPILAEQLSAILIQAADVPSAPLDSFSLLGPVQARFLPDPSANLNWLSWPGPITQILAKKAALHPHAPCVLQHDPLPRSFSYLQIHLASNVLAHHLIQSGVAPEQVVTIYSFRGVDLLLAILAILKAGATFSVIDPAYPPERQKIMLQVAQPRALILLAKAGPLSPEVDAFVHSDLQITTIVPALCLLDSGLLLGGRPAGGAPDQPQVDDDVLSYAQPHAQHLPPITLGPDSVATLSFTSGSTGIPKGVLGRHFSLTHFFPWMASTFGLDSTSRFTMLSGIAHDPIQRDIFTPIFLGAQLHIPTAEDIGTPGQLAHWMDRHQITVTHLTPAMGQLLCAQASHQIPSLTTAFFVGDILTKRDCSRLQHLAPNVDIINMFGTTETQRAVSYHVVPSISRNPTFLETQKDVIPAGKGMIDVQLVIVNQLNKDILCGVGELGEIYVRSSGLAEGYLGPPELSAEKFVSNWLSKAPAGPIEPPTQPTHFAGKWLGVRDRLYKTGDLGRYLPDGTVECVGRSDDQIKIRGFRIELGEIDTHLSQHPLVRENVTLVRRDKDEEKVLVSYFIPIDNHHHHWTPDPPAVTSSSELEDDDDDDNASELKKGIRKYHRLIRNIREYLKTKLPSHSIPTLFVPLVRMPLNPNGKIDKPALPFPDTALQASSSRATKSNSMPVTQLTKTESMLQSIWKSLLPNNIYSTSTIPLKESFFDLGGHSILATRLVFEIRRTMAVNIPLGLVFDEPTIEALAREIENLEGSDFGLARDDDDLTNNNKENVPPSHHSSTPPSHLASPLLHTSASTGSFDYAADARALSKTLRNSYTPADASRLSPKVVLLTGATGFLGTSILKDLLDRPASVIATVACHVRAKSREAGLNRLRESCENRGFWSEEWITGNRIEIILGDLEARQIGISDQLWEDLSERVDVVIHNGAQVHWLYHYSKLRSANVMATLAMMELVGTGKPKRLTFVSSTAVLEKDHYIRLSDALVERGQRGIPESDDLEAASSGLSTGYGQTKWVSERLIREAGRRGMSGGIIRPAYILGDLQTGVSNVDDFLWRLAKGCIQVGAIPDINNTLNMLPVDHVARCTVLSSLRRELSLNVYHLTARPLPSFEVLLGSLNYYGYRLQKEDYLSWRTRLEQSVMAMGPSDNALFPLLHYVMNDLPSSTRSAELDDSNTVELLSQEDSGSQSGSRVTIGRDQIGIYLAWLVKIKYLPPPPVLEGDEGHELPKLAVGSQLLKSIGRSGR